MEFKHKLTSVITRKHTTCMELPHWVGSLGIVPLDFCIPRELFAYFEEYRETAL